MAEQTGKSVPGELMTVVDHRCGLIEAELAVDSDAGDAGDLLAEATRTRDGWVIRTRFGHSMSMPIRYKADALLMLRQIAEDELAALMGCAR